MMESKSTGYRYNTEMSRERRRVILLDDAIMFDDTLADALQWLKRLSNQDASQDLEAQQEALNCDALPTEAFNHLIDALAEGSGDVQLENAARYGVLRAPSTSTEERASLLREYANREERAAFYRKYEMKSPNSPEAKAYQELTSWLWERIEENCHAVAEKAAVGLDFRSSPIGYESVRKETAAAIMRIKESREVITGEIISVAELRWTASRFKEARDNFLAHVLKERQDVSGLERFKLERDVSFLQACLPAAGFDLAETIRIQKRIIFNNVDKETENGILEGWTLTQAIAAQFQNALSSEGVRWLQCTECGRAFQYRQSKEKDNPGGKVGNRQPKGPNCYCSLTCKNRHNQRKRRAAGKGMK